MQNRKNTANLRDFKFKNAKNDRGKKNTLLCIIKQELLGHFFV